jgi:carbamoyltransferase
VCGDASKPWVLRIASSDNGAVCLLHGDEIVVAIQEERLARSKRARHPGARSSLAIRYCLDSANLSPADLNLIVLSSTLDNYAPIEDLKSNPALSPLRHNVPTMVVGHHLAHAVGAFATSGFADAAVLVVDGSGSRWTNISQEERQAADAAQLAPYIGPNRGPLKETISLYMASGTVVTPVEKHFGAGDLRRKSGMNRFWSLGRMYEAVGVQIFGNRFEAPGKMMGLAPYGHANRAYARVLYARRREIHLFGHGA